MFFFFHIDVQYLLATTPVHAALVAHQRIDSIFHLHLPQCYINICAPPWYVLLVRIMTH